MDELWSRRDLRGKIWNLLKRDKNIALFAPRRLGKTWLMQNYLQEESAENGYISVYCDLQGENTCRGAVLEIIKTVHATSTTKDALIQRFRAKLREVIVGSDDRAIADVINDSNWKSLLEIVLQDLNEGDNQYVLMLDEVTVCLAHILAKDEEDGRMFFNTLRKMRHQYTNVRWVLTGSIGIDGLVDAHDMAGAINDLETVEMRPLLEPEAVEFAHYLGESAASPFTFQGRAAYIALARIGWLSPFYIERVCGLIEPTAIGEDGGPLATENDVQAACKMLLEHPHNRAFKGWTDHIDRNMAVELRRTCRAILDYLSESKTGETSDAIHHELGEAYSSSARRAVSVLMSDGYISIESGHYRFVLPLLAEYWQKYER